MKVILFGATGMIGQGVLHECLADPSVESVLSIGRTSTGVQHPRLREIVRADLFDLSDLEADLRGHDACFFCLGVSSAGMTEEDYRRITLDLTLAVARTLADLAPGMTFVYVSGAGTDASERGRSMWARVKGETENALLRLPLRAVMFRPAFIRPLPGARSKTRSYRVFYALARPLFPLLLRVPSWATTAEQLGRAMIAVARDGAPKAVLESSDINRL